MMIIAELAPAILSKKLTRAGRHLSDQLEKRRLPVVTPFELFHLVWRMYRNPEGPKLYLRHKTPTREDYARLHANLKKARIVDTDRDYGARIIRVLTVPDLSAEEIVCLADPTAYVSHLSAMQRWGLTDRRPEALMMTRPDRETASARLRDHMDALLDEDENNPYPLKFISHPEKVRRRPLHLFETKAAGAYIRIRGEQTRLSTIGQTFLDMLQKPDLCGGMGHVLDVWEDHAETYLDEIVGAVDGATSPLVKSRAGYIIEERLGLSHSGIEPWKALGQRGGSRRLDPAKEFAPVYSETWMLSLNA